VQIREVELIFNSIDKYPQTKTDFNKTMSFFGVSRIGSNRRGKNRGASLPQVRNLYKK
jgi:hypothetical protein